STPFCLSLLVALPILRPQSGLSFVRRIIIFSAVVISFILGLASSARPVVNAVVLPPNENRDGEIMLSLDSNAYTDAMRIYLRYRSEEHTSELQSRENI